MFIIKNTITVILIAVFLSMFITIPYLVTGILVVIIFMSIFDWILS